MAHEDRAAYWNRVYRTATFHQDDADDWVLDHLARHPGVHTVLELGCGPGFLSERLQNRGYAVRATDVSRQALAQLGSRAPKVASQLLDLADPFPFDTGSFDAIAADLCLHYFEMETTIRILTEIARVLTPGGLLLTRVNSDKDVLHGAGEGARIEEGLFEKDGHYKRFFNRRMIELLFDHWVVESLRTYCIHRFANPKHLWEIVASPAEQIHHGT